MIVVLGCLNGNAPVPSLLPIERGCVHLVKASFRHASGELSAPLNVSYGKTDAPH